MLYVNGYTVLSNGKLAPAHLHEACAKGRTCTCGFCKGAGQCEWGDCRNPLPTDDEVGAVGTLCLRCSSFPSRGKLPGHRVSR